MRKNNKKLLLIGLEILIATILIIITIISLIQVKTLNNRLVNIKQQLFHYEESENKYQNENDKLKEEYNKLKEQNTKLIEEYNTKVQLAESLQKKLDNVKTDSINKNEVPINKQLNSNNSSINSRTDLSEKEKMVDEAKKYFTDRGIKINTNGYSEMVGTNLNSGIGELEGHRVFAFTIDNFDIKDNNIWFYFSPETKVGYKYKDNKWTRIQ